MELSATVRKEEIIDQLNRILLSPAFANSMILSGFLKFIVEETLEGRAGLLKEYTVGTQVLSKKASYDPQADASVRIHAGRLRKALADYYKGPGSGDTIFISVPKGTYVPGFESISPKTNDTAIQLKEPEIGIYKPTLAVIPFHCPEEKQLQVLADGLCDQICTELTNFSELAVVSYYTSRKVSSQEIDPRKAGFLMDATYLLTGSIQSSRDQVRIRVQLSRSDTQHQIWACSYEREKSAVDDFSIHDDIVKHVVNQIGGSHGIIFREAAKPTPIKHPLDVRVYDAVFWYYHLLNDINEEIFEKGLEVMKHTVHRHPNYALGWAILGETYVAGFFYGFNCNTEDPLAEAIKCGRKALAMDPHCQHTYQALCLGYVFQHRWKECLQTIDQWEKLKSKSTGIAGGLGFCLVCAGVYERGYSLLTESIQLNPYYPWWFNAGLSIYHFQRREYADAVYWAEKIQRQSLVWDSILKAAAYAEMEDIAAAQVFIKELIGIVPDLSSSLVNILGSFLHSGELVNRLLEALEKTGLEIRN